MVCTATVDARTNTGMTDAVGVPVHWLDGGWQDQPTLIADTYDDFYGGTWVNHDWGAYSTGNRAYFYDYGMVATGCDASGAAHPEFPMGNTSTMDMVAVGTPKGRSLETREDDADPISLLLAPSMSLAGSHTKNTMSFSKISSMERSKNGWCGSTQFRPSSR